MIHKRDLSPFFLLVFGAWVLSVSWQKWANITADYGRELYTPWRITCGQVLYKDIASLFGPFPPYFNALLFKLFGISMATLAYFNILLVAGFTVLIYRFISYTSDRWSAFFASAAFLGLFAFQQNYMGSIDLGHVHRNVSDQGNYAYICPYSYSVTYALFFSLWAMELFAALGRSDKDVLRVAIGFLVGLTALCRFEIFMFTALALAVGFLIKSKQEHWALPVFLKKGAWVAGGFLVPVAVAAFYFLTQLPPSHVCPSIFGFNSHWVEILNSDYYRFLSGLDHPWPNAKAMIITAGVYMVVLAAFICLNKGRAILEEKNIQWAGVVFFLLGLAGVALAAFGITRFPLKSIFKGLPLLILLMGTYLSWVLCRQWQDQEKARRNLPLFTFSLWGLLMLTKVFLNTRISDEGFVYALPAVILSIVLWLGLLPEYLEQAHPGDFLSRPIAAVLLALMMMAGLTSTIREYQMRNFLIAAQKDVVVCNSSSDPEVAAIAAFLKDADKVMGKGADFVVFPEGVMLNYLTRRADPLPYITFSPVEIISFDEQRMLNSFKILRPEYVVLNDKESGAFNNQKPGVLYPNTIREWILANYHPVWPAHSPTGNLITILKRST